MSFINIPIIFAEDDFEKKETLGLDVEHNVGEITVNTRLICAYNEMDNGNTLVRMANGDAYECVIDFDTFEDVLTDAESIVKLSELNTN